MEPLSELTEEAIVDALDKGGTPSSIKEEYHSWMFEVAQELNRTLTVDEVRQLQAALYASILGDNE